MIFYIAEQNFCFVKLFTKNRVFFKKNNLFPLREYFEVFREDLEMWK